MASISKGVGKHAIAPLAVLPIEGCQLPYEHDPHSHAAVNVAVFTETDIPWFAGVGSGFGRFLRVVVTNSHKRFMLAGIFGAFPEYMP
jgi:hypothetical protein